VLREASLIYCVPQTPLQALFQTGQLSVQEAIYGYAALIFCQHFLNRLGSEYASLTSLLDTGNAQHQEVLLKLKKRLRQETFTRDYVLEIVRSYPELLRILYVHFAMTHYVTSRPGDRNGAAQQPSLSYQRIQKDRPLGEEEIREKVRRTVCNPHEQLVFETVLVFNRHILKTNFYQATKVALSFRLDASFLPTGEYPQRPYGMFLVVGGEFRGFHVRFQDVARGGIRIIRSRNREAYSINQRTLFDETYALAATQERKNKDIPEGGSKGTLLLDAGAAQERARVAFEKYVDALLDLLIVGRTPGIKDALVDLHGRPEMLFLGPDEGTAELMDWASEHARRRGAVFWKAFTTGKSQALGGIPHDLFGMTTRSIHQYVTGIYRKLGLRETDVTKLQTGGPDGDLGSNEVKISRDRTVAVVDGSGVLCDADGIDREELLHLAQKRQMVCNFNVARLGPRGFRVLIDERDVRLPGGELVEDGLKFRNEFHLHPLSSADLFVPCGGRPEAVDIGNVERLFAHDAGGQGLVPRFKYIVEGANLFFTQEARLRLESAGVVIFKDASANKGGVTSSSLEVLAALSLTDAEFALHMQVAGGVVPEFYAAYVRAVHATIERNAELEFECLWREHELRPEKARSVLSDELSLAIVRLNAELQASDALFSNGALLRVVLAEALPALLLDKIGLDALLLRLPESYLRAVFGSFLASRFIYQYGTQPSQFAFFEFMSRYYSRPELCESGNGSGTATGSVHANGNSSRA
jgi:glutamate dehydrogenase